MGRTKAQIQSAIDDRKGYIRNREVQIEQLERQLVELNKPVAIFDKRLTGGGILVVTPNCAGVQFKISLDGVTKIATASIEEAEEISSALDEFVLYGQG